MHTHLFKKLHHGDSSLAKLGGEERSLGQNIYRLQLLGASALQFSAKHEDTGIKYLNKTVCIS